MAQGRPTNEPTNYFALGKQTAKDTEATTFFFLKHLDGSGMDTAEAIQAEHEGGDGQEIGLRYKTSITADGQANSNARPGIAGRIFAWTMGQDTVASTAGAQTHTIQPVGSAPYLTADQFWADEVERVTNVMSTGYTLTGEAGRPLKLQMPLVAGGTSYQRDSASALTATRETGDPLFFPGGSYVIDGAGNTKITKFEVICRRGVDNAIQTVALTPEDVVPLTLEWDCNFTLKYEDRTMYRKVHYGGGSVVPIPLSTGSFDAFAQVVGASTTLRHVITLMQYVGARVNKLDPDGRTVYLDVSAMSIKNTATNTAFAVVNDTVNATAAY